jgi:hypothetical protein
MRLCSDGKENDSMNADQGSARIYQFPPGGREALAGRRYGGVQAPIKPSSPAVQTSICSSSWYHEEAIQDAKPKPTWER